MMQDLNSAEQIGLRCETQLLQFGGEKVKGFRSNLYEIGAKNAKKQNANGLFLTWSLYMLRSYRCTSRHFSNPVNLLTFLLMAQKNIRHEALMLIF